MIPAPFEYLRPETLDEAVVLLELHGEEAKVLAGGQSLIPAMKFRLAQPRTVIDLRRVSELREIRELEGKIAIGAMVTHYQIESSALLLSKCPLVCEVAGSIGDVQVRNRGTLGGSLVHADPAADWPAGILALDAELELASPAGRRTVAAKDFFVDMMQTAIQPNEILCEIRVPITGKSVSYVKTAQKASGFAIAGVAVVVEGAGKRRVRVGVNGIAPKAFRASRVEERLAGVEWTDAAIREAAERVSEGVDLLEDIHASGEFRAQLARVNTRRALETALSRAG